MIIGGADPGAEGAIALFDPETSRIVGIVDMPMSGTELRVRELLLELLGVLDGRRLDRLLIERQAPYAAPGRRMGVTSAFHLGERWMALRAIAACQGWSYDVIAAARWKAHYRIAADKTAAVDCAGRLLPEDVGRWTVRRGYCTRAQAIGRAEAALIALYAAKLSGPAEKGNRDARISHFQE